jgi:hypothetical protein
MNVLLILGVSSAIVVATLALTLSVALAGRLATALATLVWLAAVASIVIWGFCNAETI